MPDSSATAETQTVEDLANAGLLRRLAALVYDSLLIVALWMVVGFIALGINGGEIIEGWLPRGLLYFACVVTAFAFYWKFWRDGGQTAGMRAWRLQLRSVSGEGLSHMQCVKRFCIALFSLGFATLWMLFDKESLTLQDRFSDTRVALTPKLKRTRKKG